MRELIEANDASHELSIRMALDAAGIEAVCEHRWRMRPRFLLVHDEDYERASRVVGSLQAPPLDLLPDTPGLGRARVIAGGVLAVLFALALWRLLHGS